MRLQGPRPEAHGPICPPSCASERDHFNILKQIAKGVGRKFARAGGEGGNGKNKTKK